MIFTKEQIDEIRERLSISGRKDTQFPPVSLPMSGEEFIALVQQGENKRVPIGTFYEEFARYIDGSERVDLLNVSRYAQQQSQSETIVPLTLEQAIEICPNDVKRPGQILTFLDSQSNEWVEWQYKGTNKEGWSTLTNWSEKTAGIVLVTNTGVATDNAGRKWQLTRYIETYVTPTSNWTYDGNSHPLATTNHEYVIYWADSPSALDSSTDTTIPTAKNAGTYTKYWKVKDMGGYPGTTGSIQVTVGKKAVTFASASASKTYDGNNVTASTEVTITGTISGETFEATAAGSAGPNAGNYKNTITITSSPIDVNTNYNIVKNEGDLVIAKANRTISWSTRPPSPIDAGTAITSNQCVATCSPSGTIGYYVGNTQISFPYTPSSTVTIVAKVVSDTNYNEASVSAQVVVNALPNVYAVSKLGNAPVPATLSDITNPNVAYTGRDIDIENGNGANGNFTNNAVLNCIYGEYPGRFKMSWFAVPSNKSLHIETLDGEPLDSMYTPTTIDSYRVYAQTSGVGNFFANNIKLVIS